MSKLIDKNINKFELKSNVQMNLEMIEVEQNLIDETKYKKKSFTKNRQTEKLAL